ncbi:unnamed protein product [Heterotrigona itama]|uniref:IQ motif and ubiquitin-like domain-containing protein n=1 Tax=Heterotrigona itama TaxID=395501 RepID=A0A6V7H4N5_9HYME|nr:unnamed protein product [Heterotrigona itama]
METPFEAEAGPYLVGWRNKLTGTVYRNTCTQTGKNNGRNDQKAQTNFTIDKFTNTERDVGVQTCANVDVRDRVVQSFRNFKEQRSEEHSNERESRVRDPSNEKILESVVKIQRFYRAHRGRQTTISSGGVSACAKNTNRQQIQPVPVARSYRSRDFVILNRTSPNTRSEFELLYNLLDRWRIHETKSASEQLFQPSRIALCSLILSKEVELLRAIDSTKTTVKFVKKEKSYRRFLDELCKPVIWRNDRGESTIVITPLVQRARSFRDTFEQLSREDTTVKERIDTLSKLREDVEPHTCRESDELIRLLNQEIDLLAGNVEESKLNWLRSGLKMAFLRLARESLRNERENSRTIQGGFRSSCKTICRSCGRLLPVEKFPREERFRSSSCNYCLYVRARAAPRLVYQPYRALLRDVRRREARAHCYTSLAFVIDAKIVYHLVNDIWHGKSAVSENDDLEELRLARFRNGEEWSPWNCLLLTATEASFHRKILDPDKFYGPMILQKFRTKNLQAKLRFEPVAEFKTHRGDKQRY